LAGFIDANRTKIDKCVIQIIIIGIQIIKFFIIKVKTKF